MSWDHPEPLAGSRKVACSLKLNVTNAIIIFLGPATHFVDEAQPICISMDVGMVVVNCLRQKQVGISESAGSASDAQWDGLSTTG